jgi:hypothetical protein
MEAIAEPFFQVPHGVNYAVDRTKNIISDCWNVESECADAAKLREQAFSVEKPRIRQAVRRKSLWGAHTERRWSQ